MGIIARLPDRVANQIAAGEVVERPVAVVKELVENALDAEARHIEISFERGGKSLIRVSDDGLGMEREDAILALERHATSKIRLADDILNIASFGFRGEALPSISSVSKFTLRTRQREDVVGTEIQVDGGRNAIVRDCGMSPGTDVIVAQLFSSVPARRKFLKTDRTEAAHIVQMSRLLAIANPGVGFTLIEDGREQFRSPVCTSLAERLTELYDRQRVDTLLHLDKKVVNYRVHGLIGGPGDGRTSRGEMHFFVNGRPVDSRLLSYALIESYHPYLSRGRYPEAFLFVEVPPQAVDVNVHPTKREIRFRDEGHVRRIVMEGIAERLQQASRRVLRHMEKVDNIEAGPSLPEANPNPFEIETSPEKKLVPSPVVFPSQTEANEKARQSRVKQGEREKGDAIDDTEPEAKNEATIPLAKNVRLIESKGKNASEDKLDAIIKDRIWRFIGVFGKGYGLFESNEGLVMVNPRAALDRIHFEKIINQLKQAQVEMQHLLFPTMLDLSPLEGAVLSEEAEFFGEIGFEIEPFGRNLFRMRGYPRWFEPKQAEQFVRDLIQKIRERGIKSQEGNSTWLEIARLAVFRVRDAGEVRSENDWNDLIDRLFHCENPLIDPRGRSVLKEWRTGELDRYFS